MDLFSGVLFILYIFSFWAYPIMFMLNLSKAIHLYPKYEEDSRPGPTGKAFWGAVAWTTIALIFMTFVPFIILLSTIIEVC